MRRPRKTAVSPLIKVHEIRTPQRHSFDADEAAPAAEFIRVEYELARAAEWIRESDLTG